MNICNMAEMDKSFSIIKLMLYRSKCANICLWISLELNFHGIAVGTVFFFAILFFYNIYFVLVSISTCMLRIEYVNWGSPLKTVR